MTQSQKTLANVCLFCGETLRTPSMCKYCGFKFCSTHLSTEDHQCIKTRYSEYVRSTGTAKKPDIAKGKFRVVCEMCGFSTSKGSPIEYAGEELVQHQQIVGCSEKVFLEEVTDEVQTPLQSNTSSEVNPQNQKLNAEKTSENQTSIVDQILKLSKLKEKGMISDEEFDYIKKELIKKFQS